MQAGVRDALPRVITTVEMFSDATICRDGGCRVVQIINRWWLYDDGTYTLTLHRADHPLSAAAPMNGDDAGARHILDTRTEAMWQLTEPAPVR